MSDEKHHNGLTPAEAERLAMLAEEAGEIVQVVGKILRHGYESFHPLQPEVSNRTLLSSEIADMLGVIALIHNDLDTAIDYDPNLVAQRKLKWTHHQGKTK